MAIEAYGEFQNVASVAGLPGMPRAVLQSLDATWRADIDLSSLPKDVSRLAVNRIEAPAKPDLVLSQ